MKKLFSPFGRAICVLIFFFIGFIWTQPVSAQGTVYCSGSFGGCTQFGNYCDTGFSPPCSSGDCCREYYNQHNNCPTTLQCLPQTSVTTTPYPTSSITPPPGGCAGPQGTWCSSSMPCYQDQICSSTAQSGIPLGCSGVCVSATIIPTSAASNSFGKIPPPTKPTCAFAGTKQKECNDCMQDNKHSWTAIGCISATGSGVFEDFFRIGIGIAGGIAFLLILFGGFQIMTSAGNPEKLSAGKELISSAIAGLLLIIFSVFLLRVIGVDILGIPGLKKL